jgi:hypothetical protein
MAQSGYFMAQSGHFTSQSGQFTQVLDTMDADSGLGQEFKTLNPETSKISNSIK